MMETAFDMVARSIRFPQLYGYVVAFDIAVRGWT